MPTCRSLQLTTTSPSPDEDITIDATGTTGDVSIEDLFVGTGAVTFTAGDISVAIRDTGGTLPLAGDDSITAGNGDHDIRVGDGDNEVTLGDNLTGSTNGGGRGFVLTGTGADTIVVGDGDAVDNEGYEVRSGAGDDDITAGAGNDIIKSGDGDDAVVSGAGVDVIWAGAGNDDVQGGDGNDQLYAGDGTAAAQLEGVDTLDGGAGDDTFFFTYSTVEATQGLTSADTVIGGEGNDTVSILNELGGETLVDDIFNNWSFVENLDVSATTNNAGVTVNAIADEAGLKKIITSSAPSKAGPNNDTIEVGEGFNNDLTVVLGGGDDTLNATNAPGDIRVEIDDDNLDGDDNLTAGLSSNDVLAITATGGGAIVDAENFESIEVTASGIGNTTITLRDVVVKADQDFTVDADSLLIGNNLTLRAFDETDGNLIVNAGAGNDIIMTGAGDDIVDGAAGDDANRDRCGCRRRQRRRRQR